jgi:hypothetical protein
MQFNEPEVLQRARSRGTNTAANWRTTIIYVYMCVKPGYSRWTEVHALWLSEDNRVVLRWGSSLYPQHIIIIIIIIIIYCNWVFTRWQ